jgi:hypothetical protein
MKDTSQRAHRRHKQRAIPPKVDTDYWITWQEAPVKTHYRKRNSTKITTIN